MISIPSFVEVSADGLRYTKSLCRLLHTLRVRYALDMIYTYSGEILIAVRLMSCPFKLFPVNALCVCDTSRLWTLCTRRSCLCFY